MLLKNALYLNPQSLTFTSCEILSCPGQPVVFHERGKAPVQDEEILDCQGMLVTPAFACGHHHVYSALARGMGAPKKIPANFPEKLEYVWWALDKCLDRDMIRASALVTAIACARNGVSFVIDHHASPHAVDGSLEIIASAFEEVGLGHLLCYEISDRDGTEIAQQGLAETESYLSKRKGLVGLHASFTVGNDTLKQAVDLAQRTSSGIHVHTAEDLSDEDHCIKHYGKRVAERFAEAGVLDLPATILAHCIHLDDAERKLVADSRAWVVQNAESNQNNKVGVFSARALGERIMLGTDGMHSDMIRSSQSAFLNADKQDGLDLKTAWNRLSNVHTYLHQNGFRTNHENDLVVIDYHSQSPTPVSQENFLGHFFYGFESRHVKHLIVNGRAVMLDGRMLHVHEADILAFARNQAERLWKKMQA